MHASAGTNRAIIVPEWIPEEVKRYLAHTENGRSIRSLAREAGCHASTILRQIRRYETRRDDPLVDFALNRLGRVGTPPAPGAPIVEDGETMTIAPNSTDMLLPSEAVLRRVYW